MAFYKCATSCTAANVWEEFKLGFNSLCQFSHIIHTKRPQIRQKAIQKVATGVSEIAATTTHYNNIMYYCTTHNTTTKTVVAIYSGCNCFAIQRTVFYLPSLQKVVPVARCTLQLFACTGCSLQPLKTFCSFRFSWCNTLHPVFYQLHNINKSSSQYQLFFCRCAG